LAAAVNDQFAKDFSVAFRQKLINGMKLSCIENNINKTSLMQYDNPAQHLKTGFLVKMGGNVKSWKKRFVVACNKSDNYNIIYYENETMKKEKGRFCCCGYVVNFYYLIAACLLFFSIVARQPLIVFCSAFVHRYQVEAFTPDETTWYGEFGIKLTSHGDQKRQWFFVASSDEQQSQWLEVRCCLLLFFSVWCTYYERFC
jgi:hypothetical protein